jgi:hypothetical protein
VGGLQDYLATVKAQGSRRQKEYEQLLGDRGDLEVKVRDLDQELFLLDN